VGGVGEGVFVFWGGGGGVGSGADGFISDRATNSLARKITITKLSHIYQFFQHHCLSKLTAIKISLGTNY